VFVFYTFFFFVYLLVLKQAGTHELSKILKVNKFLYIKTKLINLLCGLNIWGNTPHRDTFQERYFDLFQHMQRVAKRNIARIGW
jgi:hypothetical protein